MKRLRKIIILLLSFILLFSLVSCYKTGGGIPIGSGPLTLPPTEETEKREESLLLEFRLSYDMASYSVSGIGDVKTDYIVIPRSFNGKPVVRVERYAFAGNTSIKYVEIPESVKEISASAFSGCALLEKVSITDETEIIGTDAFSNCKKLTEFRIPKGVKAVSSGCFANCSSLQSVIFSGETENIGKSAFSSCTSLKEIKLYGITEIGERAFSSCTNLFTVVFDRNLSKLGNDAFSYCYSLCEFVCDGENKVYSFDGNCIVDIAKKTLIRGGSKTVIPSDGSVISIGQYAFYGCDGLNGLIIPKSITTIYTFAFSCKEETTIRYEGNKATWERVVASAALNEKIKVVFTEE